MPEADAALTLPGTGAPQVARAKATKARKGKRPKPPGVPAPELPVARVAVDIPLPHLDRPFDYLVPESLHEKAVVGCRVRVRFAGQLVDGYLLDRVATSQHQGRLAPLARVVSSEEVLTPAVARLARSVADRYAGTLSDVLRLAIPPRHAAAEAAASRSYPELQPAEGLPSSPGSGWQEYTNGPQLLDALAAGRSPRAVWASLPGATWPSLVADAVAATAASGRGSIVVVPDHRDVERVDAALAKALGVGRHVLLAADLGPRERYRRWLAVRRGQVRVVLGTRAAAFAPVEELGLLVVWDDGDDLHAEPRAPYPHVREVLALRAHQGDAGLLVGGFARTAEGASMVATGFARSVAPPRPVVRSYAPRVRATDDGAFGDDPQLRAARLPHLAWRVAHESLAIGPVLVQVPRAGYVPAVSCTRCHTRADCPACHGPLGLTRSDTAPACRWCGTVAAGWRCEECGHDRLRARVVGARRTAEEIGRAFPSTPVLTSGGGSVLAEVTDRPALVIATPGAEPVAAGGYVAALLLDTWALLGRADLRAGEEALRRWLAAAALVRPASARGQVIVVADAALRPVQALVRWDPVGHAARELDDRVSAGFPPAVRVAVLTGPPAAVQDLMQRSTLPESAAVLGPTALSGGGVRTVIRVPRSDGLNLAAALRRGAGERSARKAEDPVSVRIDPVRID